MSDTFDRFTQPARKVFTLGVEEAFRLNHQHIEPEHLLLGLIREHHGVAARALSELGVELPNARTAVEHVVARGTSPVSGELSLTAGAKKLIDLTVNKARRLDHQSIGTEHLLLGLVNQKEGTAAAVLERLSLDRETVHASVMQLISESRSE